MRNEEAFDIDVVITWVNGNDPVLSAKRAGYMSNTPLLLADDIAGTTRYVERGEIHWCIHSINKFMPWVRRIYIVTDGQDPKVESKIPVEIVDHTIIFQGYEQYLPTFNSLSIETMLWRIPGLSEHFVYFNDDVLVCRSIPPNIFFPQRGHVCCHGHKASIFWTKFRYFFKYITGKSCRVNHVKQMIHAAEIIGGTHSFIRLSHTPHPMLLSTLRQFYDSHPEKLIQNIRNRFRSIEHFRTDEIVYMQLLKEGRIHIISEHDVLVEYMPTPDIKRLKRKLQCVTNPDSKVFFLCFGSLDKATEEVYLFIRTFVSNILENGEGNA